MEPSLFEGNLVKSNRIIYTPSDFAKANLIHLQETGELQAKKPHGSSRSNLSSYLFFLVLEGQGMLEYGGRSFTLRRGDCVFVDCRKTYVHRSSEALWRLKWVHFYGPNMGGIYEKYMERGGTPCFSPKAPEKYELLLDQIYEIAASNAYIRDMKIFEKLTALLTLLMEESWRPAEKGSDDVRHDAKKRQNLQAVKEYLDLHYAEKIILEQLAKAFYINKYYLTRVFKEQFGTSVTGYLQQVRITHAKQELRFTDRTMEEIAHGCGMGDANYFARVFKKVEGVPPGDFRKMW